MKNRYYLGIDGCSEGWVAAQLDTTLKLYYLPTLEEASGLIDGSLHTLIDMPMGLLSSGDSERPCDREARKFLKKRKMSIFPVPSRQAVYSGTYEEANVVNRSVLGKGLSKQSYNLFPKIREVDLLIKSNPSLISKMSEGHPELSFTRIEGHEMLHSKKNSPGIEERIDLLKRFIPGAEDEIEEFLKSYKRRTLLPDDAVDAVSLALSLKLSSHRGYTTIPAEPLKDACGIPMYIFLLGEESDSGE